MSAFRYLLAFCVFCVCPTLSWSQDYPVKPIRLVVPFPPGGSVDMTARMVGQMLTDKLGQPVLIENRSGASGNIGMDFVAKSAPDGYTLLMAPAALSANGHLYRKIAFDPRTAFAPITRVADQPNVLIVNPRLGVKSVEELIALARQKPGELTYGSAGPGSAQHIAAEVFTAQAGVKMLHVPYKGGAPALADLVGGQIDLMFETSPTAVPFVQSKKLVALGVTTQQRLSNLPDVPAISEAGLRGYESYAWIGMAAPAGTPPAIVQKLNALVSQAIHGELNARLKEISLCLLYTSPSPRD